MLRLNIFSLVTILITNAHLQPHSIPNTLVYDTVYYRPDQQLGMNGRWARETHRVFVCIIQFRWGSITYSNLSPLVIHYYSH